MGLYNFQPRFVPLIESGAKTHTIRKTRRFGDCPGQTMHLYTGLRQRGARLIGRAVCTMTQDIEITVDLRVYVDGVGLTDDECEALAISDGFATFSDMMAFWEGRLPFDGQILHWAKKPELQPPRRGVRYH